MLAGTKASASAMETGLTPGSGDAAIDAISVTTLRGGEGRVVVVGGVRQIGEVVTSHLGSADVYSDAVTTVNGPPPCL